LKASSSAAGFDIEVAADAGAEIPVRLLDDLCSRFIVNLPSHYFTNAVKLFYEIEHAYWFYLDNLVAEHSLKPMNMYRFSALVFQHCSKLASYTYTWQAHYDEWRKTKAETPTCGAALMNSDLDQVVLVKGFTPGWMFPRGKINDREAKAKFYPQAAAREVLEETGFDIGPILDPELYIERVVGSALSRLYLVPDVPMDFKFKPETRNEIEAILWFRLSDLPTSRSDEDCARRIALKSKDFFLVIPFVSQLRRWAALVRQGGLSRVAALRKSENSSVQQQQQPPPLMLQASAAAQQHQKRSQQQRKNSRSSAAAAGSGDAAAAPLPVNNTTTTTTTNSSNNNNNKENGGGGRRGGKQKRGGGGGGGGRGRTPSTSAAAVAADSAASSNAAAATAASLGLSHPVVKSPSGILTVPDADSMSFQELNTLALEAARLGLPLQIYQDYEPSPNRSNGRSNGQQPQQQQQQQQPQQQAVSRFSSSAWSNFRLDMGALHRTLPT
ncbi:hypothetical protein BOX15_Mlig025004g2, partial [Macrostomum lignano]